MLRGCDRQRPLLCPDVPPRRGLKSRPLDYLKTRGTWPDGPFWKQTPDEALFFIQVAKRLHELCYDDDRDMTVTAIAEEANLSTQTVFNLLEGKTWGDLPSIYRLEVALGARLWVNDDIPWYRQ